MSNPNIPVDPDTDAAGDRGYGENDFDHTTLPDSEQPDDSAETDIGNSEPAYHYDPGDYVGNDTNQWHELGIELPEGD